MMLPECKSNEREQLAGLARPSAWELGVQAVEPDDLGARVAVRVRGGRRRQALLGAVARPQSSFAA